MTTKEYIEIYHKCPNEYNPYEGSEKDLEAMRNFNKELISKYPWIEPRNNWSGKRISVCAGPDGEEGFWPGDPKLHPEYNYEYTILDDMPEGWRIAFGDRMCEEIDQELRRFDYQDKYEVTEIKEKYGSLRWYDGGTPIGKLSEDYREVSTSGTPWYPDYDRETEVIREVGRDHYISFYDKNVDMTEEERQRYNLNAVYHYRIYKIIEKCIIPDIISKYENMSFNTCIECGKPAEWKSIGWISPYCDNCKERMIESGKGHWTEDSFERITRMDEVDNED